jgi:hypothetical protein
MGRHRAMIDICGVTGASSTLEIDPLGRNGYGDVEPRQRQEIALQRSFHVSPLVVTKPVTGRATRGRAVGRNK